MSSDHFGNLQKLCRICGEKRSKGRPYHSQPLVEEIKNVFDLDISDDKNDVHPRFLCLTCHSRLSNADDTSDFTPVVWKGHDDDDDCWVCDIKTESFAVPIKPAPKRKRSDKNLIFPVVKYKDVTIKVRDLNEHIICTICKGYIVEATSIIECLHTFCKSCLIKHLQTRTTCPLCKIVVHESAPLQMIRLDTKFQDIINKLVPNLYEDELRRKKEFYSNRGLSVPENGTSSRPITPQENDNPEQESSKFPPEDGRTYFHTDDIRISLCIEPEQSDKSIGTMPSKYIRCSMRLKVQHLLKFIKLKAGCLISDDLELLCNKQSLDGGLTIENIWLDTWKVKEAPMRLFYKKRSV